jgi:hypothetical protein
MRDFIGLYHFNILCYQLLDVNYVLINLQDLDRHFDRNIYSNVIFPKG